MPESVILKGPLSDDVTVNATVCANETGIELSFAGYGDHGSAHGHGMPVCSLNCVTDNLVVHVWGDINEANPTSSTSLECARESRRQPKA